MGLITPATSTPGGVLVKPGETGRFVAEVEKLRRGFGRVNVKTFVGDELAAEGVILAVFQKA